MTAFKHSDGTVASQVMFDQEIGEHTTGVVLIGVPQCNAMLQDSPAFTSSSPLGIILPTAQHNIDVLRV